MKYSKLLILLLIVSLFSLHGLSPTLARFSSDYDGLDTALIAKWDFKVGLEGEELGKSDLTNFDLFQGVVLGPDTSGNKSFFISSGESDVAIEYKVMINAEDLILDFDDEETLYLPLVFRSNNDHGTPWIRISNDDYFEVASGYLDSNFAVPTEVTTYWKWDASYYVVSSNSEDLEDYNKEVLEFIADMEPSFSGNIKFKVEGRQKEPEN